MEHEIREALNAYLRGQLSLKDFQAWLVERTWDSPNAPRLAHEIEYLIDETTSGNLDLPDLNARLHAVAASDPAVLA